MSIPREGPGAYLELLKKPLIRLPITTGDLDLHALVMGIDEQRLSEIDRWMARSGDGVERPRSERHGRGFVDVAVKAQQRCIRNSGRVPTSSPCVCAQGSFLSRVRFIPGEYHGIERFYRVMQRKLFTTHKVNLIGTRELAASSQNVSMETATAFCSSTNAACCSRARGSVSSPWTGICSTRRSFCPGSAGVTLCLEPTG